MTRENQADETDDTRRSFMKKGVLASSAVALGLAGSGSVIGQENAQEPNTALVFVNDYKPGVSFSPVSRLQQPTVEQILGYVDPANPNDADASPGAVVDPDDWNGYMIHYQDCGPGNYDVIFLREGLLQQDQTYSFTTNAVFFSNRLGLLEATIESGDNGGGGGDGGDNGGGGDSG
ncbi:hypothetical protein [Halorussus lipolyticus]|uniref:hypothetical protein n=1 Tax=Halorussus lipolyticus TaxID=3034024 RepID=UPI0023E76B20|nr:hypothetical protein [Halorussus sp. DT80]